MWIAATILNQIVCNHEKAVKEKDVLFAQFLATTAAINELRGEKAAVDAELNRRMADIEWMRLRINQLERVNNALMQKITGVVVDTPEIGPIGRPRIERDINDVLQDPFTDPDERRQGTQSVLSAEKTDSLDDILKRHNVKMPNLPVGQEV